MVKMISVSVVFFAYSFYDDAAISRTLCFSAKKEKCRRKEECRGDCERKQESGERNDSNKASATCA